MRNKNEQALRQRTAGNFWLTILLVVSALALLFAGFILRENLQHSKRDIDSALLTVTHFVDEKLKAIDLRMQQLIQSDLRTSAFFIHNTKRQDSYDLYLFYKELYDNVAADDLTHSIYAYRKSDSLVVSTVYIHTSMLEDFADYAYLQRTDEAYTYANIIDLPAQYGYSHISPIRTVVGQNVVSINNCYPLYSNRYGWLIVNVDIKKLSDYISMLVSDTGMEIQISDREGNILFSSQVKTEDRQSIGNMLTSSYSGLNFNVQHRYSFIGYYITKGYYSLIAMGITLLLICALKLVLFMKNEIIPLDRVKRELNRYYKTESGKENTGKRKPSLQLTFDQLLADARKYRSTYDEWLFFKRQDFISLLLDNSEKLRQEELNEYCQYDDVSFISGPIAIAVICALDADKYINAEEKNQDLLYLSRTLEKYHQSMGDRCIIHLRDEREIVLITEMSPLEVKQLLSYISGSVMPVSIAVGEYLFDYHKITECYHSLSGMQAYRMVLDNPLLITEHRLRRLSRSNGLEIYENVQDLCNAITRFDSKWYNKLDKLRSCMEKSLLTEDDIQQVVYSFLTNLQNSLELIGAEFSNEFICMVVKPYNERKVTLPSLSSVMDSLKEFLQVYMLWAGDNQRNSSRHTLMMEIKQYIDAHIGSDQLSLQSISLRFNMNASTFSTLFKKLFGEKFVDYIIRLRIEQSCLMLKDPALSVDAIARSVGYVNAASFSRVFKKELGCTPSEYRSISR